ncbi:MAG: DUF1566 domain-containing protein [Acidobacteriota bacterium]
MKRTGCLLIASLIAWGQDSTWKDPSTGLIWTAVDSDAPVTFSQASYHCSHLELGGDRDWRLASIEELQHLFGGPADARGYHVVGPLKLTGWQWSSTLGKEKGEAWALDFGDGARASVVMGDSGLNRALCVRSAGR